LSTAIIIGSGIAGLASAIRLKAKGYDVTVIEKNNYPGGKLSQIKNESFRFDAGPSLFTMPWLVDELFHIAGKNPKDYFDYYRKTELCNYFWEDGTRFTALADKQDFIQTATKVFGEKEKNIQDYIDRAELKYKMTAGLFLEKSLHKVATYLSKETLEAIASIPKLHMSASLNALNKKSFKSEKLVQLFNRYATYNGSSPYKTPGIMSMIPHLEMNLGTFFPRGGMISITDSLYSLSLDIGINYEFSTSVSSILYRNKRAYGVETDKGVFEADLVISNMDIFGTYHKLLPELKKPKRTLKQERSSSALIYYWGMSQTFPELDLHNILFTNDYKEEFDCLFNLKTLSNDPTVYINISCKDHPADAPEGKENWFVMINAPANYGQDWEILIKRTRKKIIEKIERTLGKEIRSKIECESILDPRSIELKTSSYRGALYGASSNSRLAAFLRHPNFSRQIENLYFCGGSVHPGGGIPLSLLSAKIVDELIHPS